jgi:inosose dehydratase
VGNLIDIGFKWGISAINWVNEDIPELGDHYTFEDLVSEMSSLGFVGTEMSRKFPQDPDILFKELKARGLRLASQWKGVLFSDPRYRESELQAYSDHVDFLKKMGCKQVVTCELGGSVHADPRRSSNKGEVKQLTDDEWKHMVEGLHQAGEICKENDMELVYHYHAGTVVEKPEEIHRLMETTDSTLVHLLYDTGHAYYGGSNPLDILNKYHDRIKHVHLKDVRKDVLEQVRNEKIHFIKAIEKGVFTVPGDGCIDFTPIFKNLMAYHYDGWAILEAEQDPDIANPYDYAEKSVLYMEGIISKLVQEAKTSKT